MALLKIKIFAKKVNNNIVIKLSFKIVYVL